MRVWLASFALALEPVFSAKWLRWAFFAAFYVVARIRWDEALTVPGVDSGGIFHALAIAFLLTMAGAVGLTLFWAVPATVWHRLSIARANKVAPKS
jgi:hypothetical protein